MSTLLNSTIIWQGVQYEITSRRVNGHWHRAWHCTRCGHVEPLASAAAPAVNYCLACHHDQVHGGSP